MTSNKRSRYLGALAALAIVSVVGADVAEARAGRGGGGIGSRGGRTYQAPAPTATAPRPAAPLERSATPAPRPGVAQAAPRPGGFFANRPGFMGGLMGGLLGAGLFGLLFGGGLFGGLGGLASFLGLLLQVALVVILAGLAFRYFARRRAATAPAAGLAHAYAGGAAPPASGPEPATAPRRGASGGVGAPAGAGGDRVGLQKRDFDAFERLLTDVQTAYGRGDESTIRASATPEMAGYLVQELADNRARGVVNQVSDVKLLQGDLSEAWREGGQDYATVAMRFSLVDHTVDAATGRTVEGDAQQPTEATEVWTFVRPRGGFWQLSAIQPA